jgi:hypothetical protein
MGGGVGKRIECDRGGLSQIRIGVRLGLEFVVRSILGGLQAPCGPLNPPILGDFEFALRLVWGFDFLFPPELGG